MKKVTVKAAICNLEGHPIATGEIVIEDPDDLESIERNMYISGRDLMEYFSDRLPELCQVLSIEST